MNVVGYVRVSTEEQSQSGAGIAAQKAAILAEAKRRGWHVVSIVEDLGYSAKTLQRPGIAQALAAVEGKDRQAEALVVAKLDRLSRSLLDFASLMARSQRAGWALVALDLGVDTTTPGGELMANIIASSAQYERRLIGERTKSALAAKKAAGTTPGRRRTVPADVRRRIRAMRSQGVPLAQIAAQLATDGVPTGQGGRRWYPATVRKIAQEAA
jgi:DNA invertase Pin-like site-specific DNA recombinase